jgi:Axonemal dynein light chain
MPFEELLVDSGLIGSSTKLPKRDPGGNGQKRHGQRSRSRSPQPRGEGPHATNASRDTRPGDFVLPDPGKHSVSAPTLKKALADSQARPQPKKAAPAVPANLRRTKIPEKYHVLEKSPVVHGSSPSDDGAWSYEAHDRSWVRTKFPAQRPVGRSQVAELAKTFDQMLTDHQDDGLEQEQAIYDAVLHELTRQVHAECADRGLLLDRVVSRYHELFARVPDIITDLDDKVEELENGNRRLLGLLEIAMRKQTEAETALAHVEETSAEDVAGLSSKVESLEADLERQTKLLAEEQSIVEDLSRQLDMAKVAGYVPSFVTVEAEETASPSAGEEGA